MKLDAQRRPVDRAEERRGERKRHDRRADVVTEAREGQLLGPRPAADGRRGLVHAHGAPGAGERQRGGQTVRSRADDDRVDRRSRPGQLAGIAPPPTGNDVPGTKRRFG